MADAFSEFLENPSVDAFQRLRAIVVRDPSYDFQSTAVEDIADLVRAEDYAAVPDALPGLMPGWLLSPRLHELAAHAADRNGDEDGARMERYLARACLRGLLGSGDGTRERPYVVTHIADEFDLLEQLDKQPASQRPVVGEDGALDQIVCTDGSELWFDVSAGFQAGR